MPERMKNLETPKIESCPQEKAIFQLAAVQSDVPWREPWLPHYWSMADDDTLLQLCLFIWTFCSIQYTKAIQK